MKEGLRFTFYYYKTCRLFQLLSKVALKNTSLPSFPDENYDVNSNHNKQDSCYRTAYHKHDDVFVAVVVVVVVVVATLDCCKL